MPRLDARPRRRWTTSAWFLAMCCACSPVFAQFQAHVSASLLNLNQQAASGSSPLNGATSGPTARFDARGRVQVDVHFNCSAAAPTQALAAAGLSINASVHVPPLCVVQGWIAPNAVSSLASLPNVLRVEVPKYALRRKPHSVAPAVKAQRAAPLTQGGGSTIDGNAISIMRVQQYISSSGVTGKGVTIGVMSDNVTSLSTIQGRGELPAVTVVPSSPDGSLNSTAGDEGTMMLEEVYAVAPGANLAFCSPENDVGYVGCLSQLIAAGASILVDDLAFFPEDLLSSNSETATAVQNVLSANPNVALFSVTENFNGSYWEGAYTPMAASAAGVGVTSLQCTDTSTNTTQTDNYIESFGSVGYAQLTASASDGYPAIFQWGDPFNENASNFDLYLYDSNGNGTCAMFAGASATQFFNELQLDGTYYVFIGTPDQSLAGKFLKLWIGGDGLSDVTPSSSGSEISPQIFVPNVVKVGATNAADGVGNTLESFSGIGPINLLFPAALQLQAPFVVSLDGNYVDANGTTFDDSSTDGLFYGTSAAAPNAAAVAALIRSAFPSLTPTQLTSALEGGATAIDSTVPDENVGYGRVDAVGALNTLPTPSITAISGTTITGGTTSSPVAFTLGGTGSLKLSVQSSNSTLVPASLVASGTAGVTISPSTCGTSTMNCTLSVTPVIGQVGSVTITLIATDGASRQGSAAAAETVVAPAPPSVSISSGGSQTITTGGALSPISFTLAGTGSLTVTAGSSNTAVLPNSGIMLSSGCGITTRTCTATLTAAGGQAGSSTITISAKDSYAQTGSANASVQVDAPTSHGGGRFDWSTLLVLAGVLLLRVGTPVRPALSRRRENERGGRGTGLGRG